MRPTSLCALAAIASSTSMRMRRWDFVAAYLQGDLELNEVVYCHAPPGYATLGSDGRPRVCRVETPIHGMAQAGRRWSLPLLLAPARSRSCSFSLLLLLAPAPSRSRSISLSQALSRTCSCLALAPSRSCSFSLLLLLAPARSHFRSSLFSL
eukprot:571434-Pleurochrysis_carterae.AAC.4